MMPIGVWIGLATAAAGFAGGWAVRDAFADRAALRAIEAAREREDAAEAAVRERADAREADREASQQRLVTDRHTIREIFKHAPPVPDHCAAPDAASSLLADAVKAANAEARGEPVAALPEPSASADTAQ